MQEFLRHHNCLDEYGLQKLPTHYKQRVLQIVYYYKDEAEDIDRREDIDFFEAQPDREKLVKKIANWIHRDIPELRYYKCASRVILRLLISFLKLKRNRLLGTDGEPEEEGLVQEQ